MNNLKIKLIKTFPFKIALKRINGLEVNSTNEVKDTYTGIFKTLMNDIKEDTH